MRPDERQDELKKHTEKAILPIMFTLVHEALKSENYEVRDDLVRFTQRTMVDQFEGLDPLTQQIVAKKATDEAQRLMRAANCDAIKTLWVAIAHCAMKAAARGVPFHPDILLVASAVEFEITELDEQRAYGGMTQINQAAHRIDNAARLNGWWASPAIAPVTGLVQQ